ncbi:MAG TPA: hypothetical protein VHZ24_21380 [Pirellulales bacterium]|nr:hypothetical protein [Pirellulales bacterium]
MEQGRDTSADSSSLAERIAQLEAVVSQQQAAIAAYQEQLERQHEQLVLLKRALFASRRERYLPSPDQRLLFGSLPVELTAADEDTVADSGEEEPPPAPAARRRGKKFVFPEGLPQRRIDYPLPPGELACCDGPGMADSGGGEIIAL